MIPHETLTRNFDPPMELCRTRAIASVEVTSEQVARSKIVLTVDERAGLGAMFGADFAENEQEFHASGPKSRRSQPWTQLDAGLRTH